MGNFKLFKDFGIRALLSTLVVGGAVAGALYLIIWAKQADLGMGFLGSSAAGAIGYYFGQHVKTEAKPQ